MSTDRREQICARLLAIAGTIAGVRRTARMQEEVSAAAGPWVVLWDGDEDVLDPPPANQRAAMIWQPTISMTPVIRIVAEAKAQDVGTTLNTIRLAAIKAITSDTALLGIVGTGGSIYYSGCTTGIQKGAKVEGELWLNFAFRYPLVNSDL